MNGKRVTETYRAVATERTPEHLDRAVLAEAAQSVKPAYSTLMAWARPLAWAATVVLSLALVLEITRTPTPEPRDEPETRTYRAPAVNGGGLLPTAEEQKSAPLQSSAKPLASPELDPLAAGTASAPVMPTECDDASQSAPETWLTCIEALEQAGLADAARRQRDLLAQSFPGLEHD